VGTQGETFASVPSYLQHLVHTLPEAYLASRDYKESVEGLIEVQEGRMTPEQAAGRMPALRRVAGACPCSKSVRWMVDEPAVIGAGAAVAAANPPAVGQPVA